MAPPSLSTTAPKHAVLRARVDADLEQAFAARAKQRGMKTSDLLRSLVLAEVGTIGPPIGHVPAAPENSKLETFGVRLPAFLMDAVKSRAKMRGMPPSRWAAALIQSNLLKLPVMTDEDTAALQDNGRLLLKIGTNVNQMARLLNGASHQTELVRLDVLTDVSNSIVRTRNVIRSIVRNTRRGWAADEP